MSRPWMPLYISDYLGDTRRLKTVEHGAYLLLIMEYWQHGGLPDDDGELAAITGLSDDEWISMRPRIARLFQDGWRHKRIDEELAKAEEISERRSASAKRRWSNRSANADANAQQEDMQTTCTRAHVPQPQPQPQDILSSHSSERIAQEATKRALASEMAQAFTRFWDAWPNKTAKKDAARAFGKVWREADAIMAGVERYIRDKPIDRSWMHPATFLNGRRWEDQPAPIAQARAGPPRTQDNRNGVGRLLARIYEAEDDEAEEFAKADLGNIRALPEPDDGQRRAGRGDGGSLYGDAIELFDGDDFRRIRDV